MPKVRVGDLCDADVADIDLLLENEVRQDPERPGKDR
jgi:hypothetical protein